MKRRCSGDALWVVLCHFCRAGFSSASLLCTATTWKHERVFRCSREGFSLCWLQRIKGSFNNINLINTLHLLRFIKLLEGGVLDR